MKFAAFIMTFERPRVIEKTIRKILTQTVTPEKILIIDNGASFTTQRIINRMNLPQLEYFRVGHNAGPAGAAKIGLQKLALDGYDWIYWGDDDDPPLFDDSFEILLKICNDEATRKEIGILGSVGQNFNRRTGTIDRISNCIIKSKEFIDVDSVAGNQCMIVNTRVVQDGILPDENLFFGFEELEFCLRVKKAGYKIMANSELFSRARMKYNRVNVKKSLYTKNDFNSLQRQYYSTRNMLTILWINKLLSAYVYNLTKTLFKCLIGFRYGWLYGKKNSFYLIGAIRDSFLGTLGRYDKYPLELKKGI